MKDQTLSRLEGQAHDIMVVKFRGSDNPLSNFYIWKCWWGRREWVCVEQAYQYAKLTFHGRNSVAEGVLYVSDPTLMKRMGSIPTTRDWETQKEEIMEGIVWEKVKQVKIYRDMLLHSDTALIVENVRGSEV